LPISALTKRESAEAQVLVELPEDTFKALIAGKTTRRRVRREEQRKAVAEKLPELPQDKYRVIYADPPWKYGDALKLDAYGSTEYHYPTMTIAELCALPVADLCQPDAVLFLWVTSPMLFECAPVIQAWGFKYKASFVWDKVKHNWGHYNSVRHEFLLLCTRGSCVPDNSKLFDSVQSIERTRKHSEKPEQFREIIDALYPSGGRLELFARSRHEGWEAYGNDVSGNTDALEATEVLAVA
jgi:N6-adenosine-specific RNA methylase IME4